MPFWRRGKKEKPDVGEVPAEKSRTGRLGDAWRPLFGGKSNSNAVLKEKAKMLAPFLIKNAEGVRTICGQISEGQFQDNKLAEVFLETTFFLLHFTDRVAFNHLNEADRTYFVSRLIEELAKNLSKHVRGEASAEFFIYFGSGFAERQVEYGKYGPEQGRGPKGTLFWEFGKKIARILESEDHASIIVPIEGYIIKTIALLDLRILLSG